MADNYNVEIDRKPNLYDQNILIVYNCQDGTFQYPAYIEDMLHRKFDSRPLWEAMVDEHTCSECTATNFRNRLEEISKADSPKAHFEEFMFKNGENEWKWYMVGFLAAIPGKLINITFTDINSEIVAKRDLCQKAEHDELTGLFSRNAFSREVDNLIKSDEEGVLSGKYAMVYLDIIRFKAVNELFGMTEGDKLLVYIADSITKLVKAKDVVCRSGSDRFVFFTNTTGKELEELIERVSEEISKYNLPFEIICNAGIYITGGGILSAESMVDRAVLAQSAIKGSYTEKYNYYNESMRDKMLGEQEIVGMMSAAIAEKQFVVYYQPQYNHSTGMLLGAEALVRWLHPERGLISPGVFIPIFEKNGFIAKLDLYVFERVCEFIRKCLDEKMYVVPVSTNFSRHDLFQSDFVEKLESIRTKYDVPVKYLRVEITESVVIGSSQLVNDVVKKLHHFGYIVQMDDFGSGYSSLNVLKDIELDVIKLDMLFLAEKSNNNRGGTILSSVVRMAKWLDMPVIAEGVETIGQADFLRSIGCDYIQGYLYSKPVPETDFYEILKGNSIGVTVPKMSLIDTFNACDFWNPSSQETLIFSNYVGGAAIFDYRDGKVEVLRVNTKYLKEICMNLTEKDLIEGDPMRFFDDYNKKIYIETLNRAIETLDEQECETWRNINSSCCGAELMCIRSNIRLIGKEGENYLFYAMIRNITSERQRFNEMQDREKRFKMASEQVNIYFWEYTVATKEMRPCFRCMRDLGLPAVLTNYPDSAIEMGVFPPEVADMYRDWHRQIEEGVPLLEAIIPLTVGRVPFHVRYTTEFDEHGRPVKAYGSAALVVD